MEQYRDYVWIFWDVAAVLFLIRIINKSARRGFVSALVGFFGYVLAAVAAKTAAKGVAKYIYEAVIKDSIVIAMSKKLDDVIVNSDEIIDAVPGLFFKMLDKGGEISEIAVSDTSETQVIVEEFVDMALKDPVMTVLQGIAFLLIFSLCAYAVRYLSGLFGGAVNHIPVIGPANTALGGILGVLAGCVFLYAGAVLIKLLYTFSGEELWFMSKSVFDDTYIWHFFINYSGKGTESLMKFLNLA